MPRTIVALLVCAAASAGFGLLVGRSRAVGTVAADPPASPVPMSCTVWRETPDAPLGPDVCTYSVPWWTAWYSCPITPIHGERWTATRAGDRGLEVIPWVRAEPASAGLVEHLFFGSRPLHTGGRFPDGGNAKVLWQSDRPLSAMKITATTIDGADQTVGIVDSPESAVDTQWPSLVDLPSAGCWRVDLRAYDRDGREVTGIVTFIAIDG
jgi:hypothetical protein